MSRPIVRVTVLGAVGVLVAGLLTALTTLGPGSAAAATRTLRPPTPQSHLASVTVTSTPRVWRFEVRTKRPADVIGYELYLDVGQRRGADYELLSVLGTTRLYETPRGLRGPFRNARCPGKRVTVLRGTAGPGVRLTVPQTCLTHYTGPSAGETVRRLRVRAAVVWTPPRGDCRRSWSPRAGAFAFHAWVANHPDRPTPPVERVGRRTGTIPAPVAARRGC